jgi:hypothetical protein
VRSQYHDKLQDQCGTLQLLDIPDSPSHNSDTDQYWVSDFNPTYKGDILLSPLNLNSMKESKSTENLALQRLQLFIYLIPVFGFFPALWTLYRRQGTREQQAVSRLSVTLAFGWLLGYILLSTAAPSSQFWTIRLLFMNSLLTSGYFLVSLGLMVRLSQGKLPRLPGISRIAEGRVRQHLSDQKGTGNGERGTGNG